MQKRPNPLTRLRIEKERLHLKSLQQEQKLNNDFAYIRANAGKLSIAALSHLFYTARAAHTSNKKGVMGQQKESDTTSIGSLQIPSDALAIGAALLPLAWSIVQPMLITWGIKKAKGWIFRKKSRKKTS